MARRPLKRIEKVILASTLFSAVILVCFWLMDKEPNRDFYIPKSYAGWVTIEYSVPDAPPIEQKDGVMQLVISDSGYLATSTDLKVGWRRDRYFWLENGEEQKIPASVEVEGEPRIYIHAHQYFSKSYEALLASLPVGTDTTLPDQTHIIKESYNNVTYEKGKKTLEYFYLSRQPESIIYNPPKNPNNQGLESTQDRAVPITPTPN